MKKIKYEKPSLKVVVLNQRSSLLQASGQAGVQNYTFEDVDPE